MRRLAILGALLLTGCSDDPFKSEFTDKQRDEIGDIAGDAVGDAVSDDESLKALQEKVDELELRLDDVESRMPN